MFLLLHLYLPGEWGEMPLGAPRSTLCSVAFKVFIISDPLIGYYWLLHRAENTSLKMERKR